MVFASTGWRRGVTLVMLFVPFLIWPVPESLDATGQLLAPLFSKLPEASPTRRPLRFWWSGGPQGKRSEGGYGNPGISFGGRAHASDIETRQLSAAVTNAAEEPEDGDGSQFAGGGKDLARQADIRPSSRDGSAMAEDAGASIGLVQTCTACVRAAISDDGDPEPWRCLEASAPTTFRHFAGGDERREDRRNEVPSATLASPMEEHGVAGLEASEETGQFGEVGVAEGEEGAEAEQEKEKEEEELMERTMAAMTLGSVAFQMSLFYVLNYRDPEIKRYAHTIIGQTISIFCAVLAFNAIYGVTADLVKSYVTEAQEKFAFLVFLMFFFIGMQILVYVCFHAFAPRVEKEKDEKDDGVHSRTTTSRFLDKQPKMDDHVLNAKTYGSQMAQICGAAAMRTFGALQLRAFAHGNYAMIWASTGIALVFFIVLLWVFSHVRRMIILQDGYVDSGEVQFVSCIQDCENEVVALTLGFLWAAAARIVITDSVPEMLSEGTGIHPPELQLNIADTLSLFALGGFCGLISMLANFQLFGVLENTVAEETLRSNMTGRVVRLLVLSISLSFAWCMCFGTHLLALQIGWFKEGLPLRLFLALCQSASAFIIIVMLDFISDMMKGPRFERAMVMLIDGLGVSVGLSWEHLFHKCVEVCVEFMVQDDKFFKGSRNPTVWAMVLSCVVVVTVLPAFRYYIVPRMYFLIEEHEERMNEAEAAFRRNMQHLHVDLPSHGNGAGPYMPADIGAAREAGMYTFGHTATSALEITTSPPSRAGF